MSQKETSTLVELDVKTITKNLKSKAKREKKETLTLEEVQSYLNKKKIDSSKHPELMSHLQTEGVLDKNASINEDSDDDIDLDDTDDILIDDEDQGIEIVDIDEVDDMPFKVIDNKKIVADLKKIAKKEKKEYLSYEEVMNYLDQYDFNDDDIDELFDVLRTNKIVSNEDDIEIDVIDDFDDDEVSIESDMYLSDDENEDGVFNLGEAYGDEYYDVDLSLSEAVKVNDPVKMYFKEIGNVPLLKPDEEIKLAKLIDIGEEARDELQNNSTLSEKDFDYAIKNTLYKVREASTLDADETTKLLNQVNDALEAQQDLVSANLRLVVSIAKRYVGRGMQILDLVQEGNIGLIKASEKYDYTKGFKFSTYATWWIRQAITRAIADQARTIRIPVHMVETINKLTKIQRNLVQELGRDPIPAEIAERMPGLSEEKVREILQISLDPVSFETPIGEEDDSSLGDFIEDSDAESPFDFAAKQALKDIIDDVLDELTDREETVLRMRFGLDDGNNKTLEEVGKYFNVTRERIRQIEAKALRKLKHPSRAKKLQAFLNK